MHVIYLRAKGFRPGTCVQVADVHRNSVTRWTKIYMEQGVEGLRSVACYRPVSDLVSYADKIKADFKETPPRDVSEARKRIKQLTGLKRGLTQVRKFVVTNHEKCTSELHEKCTTGIKVIGSY